MQSVAEVSKQKRGLDSTETEVKRQACGLGFSSLNPLSPPTALPRYSMCVNDFVPVLSLLFRHTIPDSSARKAIWYSMKIA